MEIYAARLVPLAKPKPQIPNPKSQVQTTSRPLTVFGSWDLGFGIWDLLFRRLDMDDDVHDFGEAGHQPILDDVRQRMGFGEWCPPVNPHVEVDEHVIRG